MMTRLIRPCTLWNKTFDAIRVKRVLNNGNGIAICLDMGQSFISQCSRNDVNLRYFEVMTTIVQALNAPVLATEEVLDAMNKVPEAQFWHVEGTVNTRLKWNDALKTFNVNGQTLSITDYIQADCPLALEALLKFYTDGTPILK